MIIESAHGLSGCSLVLESPPDTRSALTIAAQEALVALAVLKLNDVTVPYSEIGPDLRAQIIRAHDLLLDALITT